MESILQKERLETATWRSAFQKNQGDKTNITPVAAKTLHFARKQTRAKSGNGGAKHIVGKAALESDGLKALLGRTTF